MRTLREAAIEKVFRGITTTTEMVAGHREVAGPGIRAPTGPAMP